MIPVLPWRRRIVDKLTARVVGFGGGAIIGAITLIFFYLLMVAAPIFRPADISELDGLRLPASNILAAGTNDSVESLYAIDADGTIFFVDPETGAVRRSERLTQYPLAGIRLVFPSNDIYALVGEDGTATFVRVWFRRRFDGDIGYLEDRVDRLFGGKPLPLGAILTGQEPSQPGIYHEPGNSVARPGSPTMKQPPLAADAPPGRLFHGRQFDFYLEESVLRVAVLDAAGSIRIWQFEQVDDTLAFPRSVDIRPRRSIDRLDFGPRASWLYATNSEGAVTVYDIAVLDAAAETYSGHLVGDGVELSVMTLLLGRYSLMAADNSGNLTQWILRGGPGGTTLVPARNFEFGDAISAVVAEPRRKGMMALDAQGGMHLLHSTSERHLASFATGLTTPSAAVFSPRSDRIFLAMPDGDLRRYAVTNHHPEISWSALWHKVWYEGYPEPVHSWQSSSADNDFEPKFSFSPLLFGTLKAAFYAMIFATPIAVMGAVYTGYFMAAPMRRWVKPGIEIMAAMPTVILGFVAGLWFAPLVEQNLSAVLSLFVAAPVCMLVFAWFWHLLPSRVTRPFDGWFAALSIPVLVLSTWAVFAIDGELERLLFGGDAQAWFLATLGLDYDQRNALVVGIAMGLAVIPVIFAISEDAIHGVPRHLTTGSLALGATNWQTLTRVVILTASPGIFSALMIGLGRAVGETMIVLMATGNTPLMDLNIFQGMRTFAANIAVELPESEVDSSHYRLLFLAALVLFLITFFFNTGAELVRQRLRARYGNL